MKIAKIISLIGGFLYLFYWLGILFTLFQLNTLYADLSINYNPWPVVIGIFVWGLVLVSANFGFFYYLRQKEKKETEVKNAVLYSLLIAVVPLVLYLVLSTFAVVAPLYTLTDTF